MTCFCWAAFGCSGCFSGSAMTFRVVERC